MQKWLPDERCFGEHREMQLAEAHRAGGLAHFDMSQFLRDDVLHPLFGRARVKHPCSKYIAGWSSVLMEDGYQEIWQKGKILPAIFVKCSRQDMQKAAVDLSNFHRQGFAYPGKICRRQQ